MRNMSAADYTKSLIREKEKVISEKNIIIRLETKDDYRAVENLTRESFWNVYQPGCMEHYVLHCYKGCPGICAGAGFCDGTGR